MLSLEKKAHLQNKPLMQDVSWSSPINKSFIMWNPSVITDLSHDVNNGPIWKVTKLTHSWEAPLSTHSKILNKLINKLIKQLTKFKSCEY